MIDRNKPVRISLNIIPMLFDAWFKENLHEDDQDAVLEFIHAQLRGKLSAQERRKALLKAEKTALELFDVI